MQALSVTSVAGAIEWPERRTAPDTWLISRSADVWLACAGGGVLLVAMAIVLLWHGDRELDATDLLLSELHLGATYHAVAHGQLWRRMPFDVVVIPLLIAIATYVLMLGGLSILITTATLYLGAWHRGRQNFGIARYYQTCAGGALSPWHARSFDAAIYLPMAAGIAYFTSASPSNEGDPFLGPAVDPRILAALGLMAAVAVAAYLTLTARHRERVHPGERMVVAANAIAFGSAYVLGAWNVSFILVLVVHHEVQYLYFTYAMARRATGARLRTAAGEFRLLASFATWPLLGLASWALCRGSDSEWIPPFLASGLLCHYWLDGRIWTRRARRLAAS